MRKLSFMLMLFAAAAMSSHAANLLQVGAGKTYATIQAAVTAAVSGDTINVDSGTYPETIAIFDKNNITLTADADVTITAPTGTDALFLQNCAGFTLKGASATKHFYLVSTAGTALKAIWALSPNLLVEDVEFRGSSSSFAVTCGSHNGDPITFNRCLRSMAVGPPCASRVSQASRLMTATGTNARES